jgi:hypothetical protein
MIPAEAVLKNIADMLETTVSLAPESHPGTKNYGHELQTVSVGDHKQPVKLLLDKGASRAFLSKAKSNERSDTQDPSEMRKIHPVPIRRSSIIVNNYDDPQALPKEYSKRLSQSSPVLSPLPIPAEADRRAITPEIAENVLFRILYQFEHLDDLFTTAIVNRGFYCVFKRYELELIRNCLRKMSLPAWAFREICYLGHDHYNPEDLETAHLRQEYTPTLYLQNYARDMYVIAALKSLICDKCQSFLRPEILVALASDDPVDMTRVDDALWRIWAFCKIFGCGKNREEDIVVQMDWLKGMNKTLENAPEYFASGNEGGLSAEQLFDMMELWNCLGVLLQPFEGRAIQAREFGIYENTDIRGGDIDGEEAMLDEWYYYLLTLGLPTVLDLAALCRQADPSAFKLAQQHGWNEWEPPAFGGTRRNFLKEAASRVYENKQAQQRFRTSPMHPRVADAAPVGEHFSPDDISQTSFSKAPRMIEAPEARKHSKRQQGAKVESNIKPQQGAKAESDEYGHELQVGSASGDELLVRILLNRAADLNVPKGVNNNALHVTSKGGYEQMVKLLLDKGNNVNAQGGYFGNALQATSAGGYEQVRISMRRVNVTAAHSRRLQRETTSRW